MKQWLDRNKGPVGAIFLALWGWATLDSCPVYFGLDFTAHCDLIQQVLGMAGSFMVGAGVISSDMRKRIEQGRIDPYTKRRKRIRDL